MRTICLCVCVFFFFFFFFSRGLGCLPAPRSVTKAIAGLQIRALLQLLGCLLMIDLTVCIFKLLGGQLSVFGLRNHCHRNRHEILHKNVSLTFVLVKS